MIMASQPIILSDPRVLAEFMRQSEFQSFFEKRFAVPPDYAALLFKNGELIDAFNRSLCSNTAFIVFTTNVMN